jgi:hypothetical protein
MSQDLEKQGSKAGSHRVGKCLDMSLQCYDCLKKFKTRKEAESTPCVTEEMPDVSTLEKFIHELKKLIDDYRGDTMLGIDDLMVEIEDLIRAAGSSHNTPEASGELLCSMW